MGTAVKCCHHTGIGTYYADIRAAVASRNENLVIGIEILPFMSAFADCTADEIEIRLQSVVDEINTQLPTYKRISKLVVRTEDFKRSRAMKILREQ